MSELTAHEQRVLTNAEAAVADIAAFEANRGSREEFWDVRKNFLNSMRRLEQVAPDLFSEFVRENPVWGVRYDASLATGRYFTDQGIDPKMYADRAQAVAYAMSQEAGYGEDGKKDGRTFASGYGGNHGDINNENGPGDFFKLGTPSKVKGGVLDFIEDNPLQVAGMVASFAMPWLSAPLAGALGVTTAGGQALLTAGLTGGTTLLTGGDAKDALLAAALAGGTSFVKNSADVAKKAGEVANTLNEATGLSITGDQLLKAGLVSVKGDPIQGVGELVVGEGLDKLWESAPQLSDLLNNAGIETDAINATMIEGVKSGFDPLDMAEEFVREGGLPNIDINMPDILPEGAKVNWGLLREVTDPIEEAVQNAFDVGRDLTDPLEEAGQTIWDVGRDLTDPLEEAGKQVVDTVQALPWPGPIENPLPEMSIPLPDISVPDIPKPEGDVPWLDMAALAIPFLMGNNNNNNNNDQNKGVMDVTVAPQDMSYGYDKPDYGTVEQKPLLPNPGGPINDLLSLEEKERMGLI